MYWAAPTPAGPEIAFGSALVTGVVVGDVHVGGQDPQFGGTKTHAPPPLFAVGFHCQQGPNGTGPTAHTPNGGGGGAGGVGVEVVDIGGFQFQVLPCQVQQPVVVAPWGQMLPKPGGGGWLTVMYTSWYAGPSETSRTVEQGGASQLTPITVPAVPVILPVRSIVAIVSPGSIPGRRRARRTRGDRECPRGCP